MVMRHHWSLGIGHTYSHESDDFFPDSQLPIAATLDSNNDGTAANNETGMEINNEDMEIEEQLDEEEEPNPEDPALGLEDRENEDLGAEEEDNERFNESDNDDEVFGSHNIF